MKNIELLNDVRYNYNLNDEFYEKTLKFLKNNNKFDRHERMKLLNDVPLRIRSTVLLSMYQDVIKDFKFFKYGSSSQNFCSQVVYALRPLKALKKEIIIDEFDFVEEVLFVKTGVLSICLGCRFNEEKIMYINKKEHFGDIMLISKQKSQFIVKVSSKIAELFTIKKLDFEEILNSHMTICKKILTVSSYNYTKMLELMYNKMERLKKVKDTEEQIGVTNKDHKDKYFEAVEDKIFDINEQRLFLNELNEHLESEGHINDFIPIFKRNNQRPIFGTTKYKQTDDSISDDNKSKISNNNDRKGSINSISKLEHFKDRSFNDKDDCNVISSPPSIAKVNVNNSMLLSPDKKNNTLFSFSNIKKNSIKNLNKIRPDLNDLNDLYDNNAINLEGENKDKNSFSFNFISPEQKQVLDPLDLPTNSIETKELNNIETKGITSTNKNIHTYIPKSKMTNSLKSLHSKIHSINNKDPYTNNTDDFINVIPSIQILESNASNSNSSLPYKKPSVKNLLYNGNNKINNKSDKLNKSNINKFDRYDKSDKIYNSDNKLLKSDNLQRSEYDVNDVYIKNDLECVNNNEAYDIDNPAILYEKQYFNSTNNNITNGETKHKSIKSNNNNDPNNKFEPESLPLPLQYNRNSNRPESLKSIKSTKSSKPTKSTKSMGTTKDPIRRIESLNTQKSLFSSEKLTDLIPGTTDKKFIRAKSKFNINNSSSTKLENENDITNNQFQSNASSKFAFGTKQSQSNDLLDLSLSSSLNSFDSSRITIKDENDSRPTYNNDNHHETQDIFGVYKRKTTVDKSGKITTSIIETRKTLIKRNTILVENLSDKYIANMKGKSSFDLKSVVINIKNNQLKNEFKLQLGKLIKSAKNLIKSSEKPNVKEMLDKFKDIMQSRKLTEKADDYEESIDSSEEN